LELRPDFVEAHLKLGIALRNHGKLEEALAHGRRAVELRPDSAEAHNNLGVVLKDLGKLDAAVACFRRVLELRPGLAAAHTNLGNISKERGQIDEALASYRRAIALDAGSAEAHNNLGLVLKDQGKLGEAVSCFQRVIELRPDFEGVQNSLGNAFKDQGRLEESVGCYRRALEQRPDSAEAHNNLGAAYMEQGRLDQAEECYRQALALKPEFVEAHRNLGDVFTQEGKRDEGVACYERALEIDPEYADAYNHLGIAVEGQGNLEAASGWYRRAVALRPAYAAARSNLGLLLLLRGEYEEGWREYERRLECAPMRRKFSKPRWNGERIEGRSILIYDEQGFGDAIQFVRYASLVQEQSGAERVLLEVHPKLARLFAQNEPWNAEIVPGRNTEEDALPPFDFYLPQMSLPLALGLYEPLPMPGPYLRADSELRAVWRGRLGAPAKVRVGLVWAGSPEHKADQYRSMQPEHLLPLLQMPGLEFYSLQIGRIGCADSLREAGLIDLTASIDDFADTAALVAELDLVVSVDTAVAHLAGAMGRPVWLLLSFQPEWRWGVAGDRTPWYATMRLFRQTALGDWNAVVRSVAIELAGLAKGE
jgi:tetratricopeptide (TPR) repeat protein